MTKQLTHDELTKSISTGAAALRMTLKLEAVSPKVFPPTYEGGLNAVEERRIGGTTVPCVLLDSVPSQANRMELALQEAHDAGEIELPVVSSDFSKLPNEDGDVRLRSIKITSLQAPHRIADAILRDSLTLDKKKPSKFKDTEIGRALDDEVRLDNATALLKFAPHCLVFGIWHSTGDKRRAMGVKIPRALVSEIIGVNAIGGKRTNSRIDPLNIRVNSGVAYKAEDGWTLDEKLAIKEKGKAVKIGKDGKPSELNHGNVTPSIAEKAGGFTIDYAEQTTVLSFSALRRLRFPLGGEPATRESDLAARVYLASLGLLSATLALDAGYDLRSRCILRPTSVATWNLLGRPGVPDQPFELSREGAINLYQAALESAREAKLPIATDGLTLVPSPDLVILVKKSMELTAAEVGEQ